MIDFPKNTSFSKILQGVEHHRWTWEFFFAELFSMEKSLISKESSLFGELCMQRVAYQAPLGPLPHRYPNGLRASRLDMGIFFR